MKTLLPTSYRLLLFVLLQAASVTTQAQTSGSVGIGTSTPNASAVLDLTATNKGLLVPRLDSAARVSIPAPATGLLVFQTSPRPGFYYYAGTATGWLFLADKARGGDNLGSHTATQALNLQGNALVGSGADLPAGVRGIGVRADGGLNISQHTPGESLYVGYQTGQANTGGYYNQFIGRQAGQANTTGYQNQFSGYQSGYNSTTGNRNQFSGYRSGLNNTTGNENYFSGYESGYANTTGSYNQFSGTQSGYNTTTGNENYFSGYQSGYRNTTGYQNQFSGYQSGYNTTTGSNNQFSGYQSGYRNTMGERNWFSGYQSGYRNTTGGYNQFSGYESGYNNATGNENYFSGYQSGYRNTTGYQNQFGGYQSGYANTTGNNNQFSGYRSGYNNTTGNLNQFSGTQSGYNNTTGSNNWAFGYNAGPTTGNLTNAGAIGYQAHVSQSNSLVLGGTGSNAVRVGIGITAPYSQLSNTADNVAGSDGFGVSSPSLTWSSPEQGYTAAFYNGNTIGFGGGALAVKVASASAGTAALDVSRGSTQNAVGATLLRVRADGNVGIGTGSPAAQLEVQLPTATAAASLKLEHRGSNLIVRALNGGNSATIIENTAGNLLLEPSGQGNVGINQTNPTYRLDVGGSIYASGAIISLSDARFKTQVRPLTAALASVKQLRGVRYQLNALGLRRGGEAGEQIGLLAQELEQVYPELVRTDAQGYKAVNYAQLTPVLLEAIRELAAQNEELQAQLRQQQQRAEASTASFEQRLRALEAATDRAATH